MASKGAPGFSGPAGKGTEDAVMAGEPDGQKASFPLATKMEENALIVKCLAHRKNRSRGGRGGETGEDGGVTQGWKMCRKSGWVRQEKQP